MSVDVLPAGAVEIRCPCCGAYLGTIDAEGSFMRFPPCRQCGWQWVGEAVGKRARRCVETPAGRIEIKNGR
jgi:hypothetical protein